MPRLFAGDRTLDVVTTTSAEILEAAAELLTLGPPRAEIWVSGLLADLDACEYDGLVDEMSASTTPESITLAATLAVVAEANLAARFAGIVNNSDSEGPWWLHALGTAAPVDATRILVGGEAASLILRFEHSTSERHLLLIDIDDGVGIDIRFAPDGLLEEIPEDDDIVFAPVAIDEAAAEAAKAIESADQSEPSIAMNLAVARRRIESVQNTSIASVPAASNDSGQDDLDRDVEGDAAAIAVLESSLASHFSTVPGLHQLDEVAAALRSPDESVAADVDAVFAAAGLTGDEADEELVLRFIGAYATPRQLVLFDAEERQAIRHLEWADWLGAVIGTVRAGEGAEVTPAGLVKAINRCPEITTTIPKRDADYVAWAFELTLHAWAIVRVLDERDRLTEFGETALPHALKATWEAPSLLVSDPSAVRRP